ncbi:MAG: hypothetical protein CSA11_06545 [Chloroflexi bacterium]|nr:MAG: hypothetical protein CSB13_06535 [Chloroflexota bacterium]PIE80881.1 MAG: hypothetical protein CSA11_06545 [Chloroflexota bacterium]
MSKDPNDIPEVFRRAMRDAGWDYSGGGDDDDPRGRSPFPSRPKRSPSGGSSRILWITIIIFLLLISFNWIIVTYTDWIWFRAVRYDDVWLKQFAYKIVLFVIGFSVALAVIWLNWHIARKRALQTTNPLQPQILKLPWTRWIIALLAIFLAFGFGTSISAQWETALQFLYSTNFGTLDPLFGLDVSFYLFSLPLFEFIQGWIAYLLFITLAGAAVIYAGNNLVDLQKGQWRPQNIALIRRHIVVLVALLLLAWAAGYLLDIYQLVYSPRGTVFGAGYTDVNATRWALIMQLVFLVVMAIAVFINFFRFNIRIVLISGGLWLAATLLVAGLFPRLLQRYAVEPNELKREGPYIADNIEFTRLAFGLKDVTTQPFGNISILDQTILNDEKAEAILRNVRLWDYRPLEDTYTQLQALRPYYKFGTVDIDRYTIDGATRQVMLSVRELNKDALENRSWVNLKLEFTHGYGLVMNPVDQITTEGQPEFYIQDLPPQSIVEEIQITQPEVYYGELMSDEVFVSPTRPSFSYPRGSENIETVYTGKGGVLLSNFFKRLVFALRLADANVILSNEIDNSSRVLLYREIRNRVSKIAPFLVLDGDPYVVVTDAGELIWILDAYTISNKFPYATPTENGFNYIRNAVKITIDAYNGTVKFYIADEDDPIIKTYDSAFPGLFQPLSAMPQDLLAHLRYPEGMFRIQTEQYLTYHMTEERVFYNREDIWQIPQEIFDGSEQAMEPYYVTMPLPGEVDEEYLLIQPVTPIGKSNMIAWIAARNDVPNYGELVVYVLPKQELIFGPLQVEARINQDPEISGQFSLWDQRGSRVIRGNLLVIPVGESFLYVEPVYLLSDTSALPELKRVIVATDTRIAMAETLNAALLDLLQEAPGELPEVDEVEAGGDEAETAVTEPVPTRAPLPADASLEALIKSANAHYEAAEAAQRAGDWASYGAELDALQLNLAQLMALVGENE